MNNSCSFHRWLALGSLALVLMVGCSKSGKDEKIVVKIDPPTWMEATGNGAIKVVNYPDGSIREKSIPYADGSFGQQFYRPDKTLEKTVTYYPPVNPQQETPPVKAEATWSKDGKALVMGKVYRPDGSLMYTQENTSDGKRIVTRHLPDGVRFSKTVTEKGKESSDITYFKPDGSVWKEEKWDSVNTNYGSGNSIISEKQYGKYGNLEWTAEYTYQTNTPTPEPSDTTSDDSTMPDTTPTYNASTKVVTYYNASGKVTYKQGWTLGMGYHDEESGEEADHIDYVEVMNPASGKVDTTYWTQDSGEVVFINQKDVASGKKHFYKDENSKKFLLQKEFMRYGSPVERFLHTGPVEKYEENKTTTKPEGTVFDTVDYKLFLTPANNSDLAALISSSWSDNNVDLGSRDDSDPCKWYRRP